MDMENMEKKKLSKIVWLTQNNLNSNEQNATRNSSKAPIKHYMVNLIGIDFVMKWLNDKQTWFWKVRYCVFLWQSN